MDLDDEELKLTRKMNGSDKNVGSIEKDIERCKQLTKLEHANWIGLSNQHAIEHLIKAYKELEEENKTLKKANNIAENVTIKDITNVMNKSLEEFNREYIPVSLVKEKIEELEADIEDYLKTDNSGRFTRTNCIFTYKKEALQELLERRNRNGC